MEITLMPISEELKNKYSRMEMCQFEGCIHKTRNGLCSKHNPERKRKLKEYSAKYQSTENGRLKNLEANNRYHARLREYRDLFEELPFCAREENRRNRKY